MLVKVEIHTMILPFSILSGLVMLLALSEAQSFSTGQEGDNKNPLIKFDVPFVPEEFRSSPKRIIFDRDDFVPLLPSQDLESPLRDAILAVLEHYQNGSSNGTKVICDHCNIM